MVANSKTVGGIRFFEGNSADSLRDGKLEVLLIRFPDTAGQLQQALSGILTQKANDFVYKFTAPEITFRFGGKQRRGRSTANTAAIIPRSPSNVCPPASA